MTITILSIQVGRSQHFLAAPATQSAAKAWTSAIIKRPVGGKVLVDLTNIAGDEQADLKHHGGVDKAVLGYAAEHYRSWRVDLPDIEFPYGGFGENLTIDGANEQTCCIGDVFAIGDCRLQISQPRQPCWKLSRRWNLPELSVMVQKSGRTGWYFRVLTRGVIEAGMQVVLLDRLYPQFTVAQASAIMHNQPRSQSQDLELAACPALSASWKETLVERATKGQEKGSQSRLFGA